MSEAYIQSVVVTMHLLTIDECWQSARGPPEGAEVWKWYTPPCQKSSLRVAFLPRDAL